MARKELTQKEWDQANDLSDELMTLIVSKGTSVSVSVVAVAFLMAKALLSLSDNNKAKAHDNVDNVVIPNITLAIDEFESSDIKTRGGTIPQRGIRRQLDDHSAACGRHARRHSIVSRECCRPDR